LISVVGSTGAEKRLRQPGGSTVLWAPAPSSRSRLFTSPGLVRIGARINFDEGTHRTCCPSGRKLIFAFPSRLSIASNLGPGRGDGGSSGCGEVQRSQPASREGGRGLISPLVELDLLFRTKVTSTGLTPLHLSRSRPGTSSGAPSCQSGPGKSFPVRSHVEGRSARPGDGGPADRLNSSYHLGRCHSGHQRVLHEMTERGRTMRWDLEFRGESASMHHSFWLRPGQSAA